MKQRLFAAAATISIAFGVTLFVLPGSAVMAAATDDGQQTLEELQAQFQELYRGGKTGEAEALARQLLASEEAAGHRDTPGVQVALDLLLEIFPARRDQKGIDIEAIGKRAMGLREKLQGPEAPQTAQTCTLWAVATLRQGNYSEARLLIDRAVQVYENVARDHPDTLTPDQYRQYAGALNAQGGILGTINDWNGARRAMLKNIELRLKRSAKPNPGLGIAWLNLGRVEHYSGQHEAALERFAKSLAIFEEIAKPDSPSFADVQTSLGRCLAETGKLEEARRILLQALAGTERAYGEGHHQTSHPLTNLAHLEMAAGNLAMARQYAESANRIDRKAFGPIHPDVADTEALVAQILAASGDSAGALEHALAAEKISRNHIVLSVASMPEREANLYALQRTPALDTAIGVAVDYGNGRVGPAFDAVIRSRALVFDELATRHRAQLQASSNEDGEEIWSLATQLAEAKEKLARLISDGASPAGNTVDEVHKAVMERDAIERTLAARSSQYRRRLAGRNAGLEEVAAALPREAALVSFRKFRHEVKGKAASEEYAAFVQVSGIAPAVINLGPALRIDEAVNAMRSRIAVEARAPGLATRRNESSYRAASEPLRTLVWDPLERYLAGAKMVFVVPEGSLHLVNFGALPARGSESGYLIETGPVFHYLSAERDLVTVPQLDSPGFGLLAVGNPAFDQSAERQSVAALRGTAARSHCSGLQNLEFVPLPASAAEISSISQLWKRLNKESGDAVELTGPAAATARFKSLAPGRRVIHLAVHGFFAGEDCSDEVQNENPLLLSGIALSGANRHAQPKSGGDDGGILTAEEIAGLDLRGVEWAVLSACDTGLGKVSQSEGVFGLRRAFQIAGAHSVVMSLWPVEDVATREWMQTLYEQRLSRRLDTASAVRQASLLTLKKRRAAGQATHPFYWAGFVAAGDWR